MAHIHILDELTANQIAAGEVVERPASVVKELVENAVDAQATRIAVTLEEGGLQRIVVRDNGTGIAGDELEMAFQRHATSKIAVARDLFQIHTLGFRGEALPSIAAVSKVMCTSSTSSDGLGRQLTIEGGKVVGNQDCASDRGTTFVVQALFYNTPARLKYMKAIQTELGHISDYLYRMALAYPHIAFSLTHNGSELLRTMGDGERLHAFAAIYGSATAKQMKAVTGESLDYKMTGYVSEPGLNRANRNGITFIINGRYIRNFLLNNALLQAYHTLLPINRYPMAVIAIEMDPTLVDVNVHPAKWEVRFSKEQELFAFIQTTIGQLFQQYTYIPSGFTAPKVTEAPPKQVQQQIDWQAYPQPQVNEPRATVPSVTPQAYGAPSTTAMPANFTAPSTMDKPEVREVVKSWIEDEAKLAELSTVVRKPALPNLEVVGQVHGTYIVAQNEQGLYLIDQHAAHERIHYEQFYAQFGNPQPISQELLIPITLEFNPTEAKIVERNLDQLAQVGVVLEAFGSQTFRVTSHPYWFPKGEEKATIEEMLEWVLAEKQLDLAKLREKAAILVACKASIKANQAQTNDDLRTLIQRLGACQFPFTCPHGRPIVISFSSYELEKLFKRVT